MHATQKQIGAKTSRFAVSLPPLQQVPKDAETGIRRGFTCERGERLIRADLSQGEIRMMGVYSQDSVLCDILRAGGDVHTATAEGLGVSRAVAKALNFGLFYGLGPYKLALQLTRAGQPTNEHVAKRWIASFFSFYAGIKPFKRKLLQYHLNKGYVRTICGRIRRVPNLDSRVKSLREGAERILINNLIQGSIADLMKLAMLRCARDPLLKQWGCLMLLQIHDELIFKVPKEHAFHAAVRVKKLMEAAPETGTVVPLNVPFVTEPKICKVWGGEASINPLKPRLFIPSRKIQKVG